MDGRRYASSLHPSGFFTPLCRAIERIVVARGTSHMRLTAYSIVRCVSKILRFPRASHRGVRVQGGCLCYSCEWDIDFCRVPCWSSPLDRGTNTDPLNQLDSLKSRLQTIKHPISVPSLAVLVYREEGFRGFYRGLWIPLVTITFVRMSGLFLVPWYFSPSARVLMMSQGAASFTIYSGTKDTLRDAQILNQDTLLDTSLVGGLGSDPDYPLGTLEC
jgi:hypothetical protein